VKKIAFIALLSLTTVSISLLSSQAARADKIIYCHPVTDNQVSRNPADRPHTYADGYREGEQSFRDGVAYKPRTGGGEFARGFEDGYFNRPYTGQELEQNITQKCHEESGYDTVMPPSVIYNYPYVVAPPIFYNYPFIDFDFGFGGWHHGWGHHSWGYRGRW